MKRLSLFLQKCFDYLKSMVIANEPENKEENSNNKETESDWINSPANPGNPSSPLHPNKNIINWM